MFVYFLKNQPLGLVSAVYCLLKVDKEIMMQS